MAATHATVTKGGVATALVGNLPAVGSQAPTVLGTNHELKDITLDSDELKGKVKILNVKLPPFLPSTSFLRFPPLPHFCTLNSLHHLMSLMP
jgi:hypothetical protein